MSDYEIVSELKKGEIIRVKKAGKNYYIVAKDKLSGSDRIILKCQDIYIADQIVHIYHNDH